MLELATEVSQALGQAVSGIAPLGGGDVAQSFRVELEGATVVFAKTKADAHRDFFDTEARGLSWLRDAGAVPVPEVLHVSGDPPMLVLEWIEPGGRPDEDTFGRALAELHCASAPCFGRQDRRPTGSRRLPNEPFETWAESYAENRLRPLARLAADQGALPPSVVADLDDIADRLPSLVGPTEPAARLHGDLWAGNRMVDASGRSWLIDPAAHGGHREFDLAMMRLFGGFDERCFAAYDEAYPLAEGWPERVALHQLAPLAVHAIKFGGGYRAATARAAAQYC